MKWLALVLAVAFGPATWAQTAGSQQTSASITGRVVDAQTGKPVAHATVTASTNEGAVKQRTGANGEFAFTFPKPVQIRLSAERVGALRTYAGQTPPTQPTTQTSTINLTAGARIEGVVIKIYAYVVIAGKVTSGAEPVVGATVVVLKRDFRGNGFAWAKVPLKSARSDDRGQYRIATLAPGEYLVAVTKDGDSSAASGRPVFAPGTLSPVNARTFLVAPGEEATDANIQLDPEQRVGSIFGRVLDAGRGVEGLTVRVQPNVGNQTPTDLDEITATTEQSGRFRISGLPVGSYTLRVVKFPESTTPLLRLANAIGGYAFGNGRDDATSPAPGSVVPPLPDAPTLFAERDVVINAEASEEVLVSLQPAARIRGRVLFQDGSPMVAEDLAKVPVLIRPSNYADIGLIPLTRIEPDGSFKSVGLPPGEYVVVPLFSRPKLTVTWTTIAMTSGGLDLLGGTIRLDGADVTDVVVIASTKPAQVTGTVSTANAAISPLSTRVIFFPKSERLRGFYYAFPSPRRVVQASVSPTGAFRATLPPGEYFAVALSDDLPEFWMTPDFLQRLMPFSTSLQVGTGTITSLSLAARSVPVSR